jgi:hypothetical protein
MNLRCEIQPVSLICSQTWSEQTIVLLSLNLGILALVRPIAAAHEQQTYNKKNTRDQVRNVKFQNPWGRMKLRNHPLMSNKSGRNWPPIWKEKFGDKILTGEIGVLTHVGSDPVREHTISLRTWLPNKKEDMVAGRLRNEVLRLFTRLISLTDLPEVLALNGTKLRRFLKHR